MQEFDWVAIGSVFTILLGSGGLGVFINKKIPRHTQLVEIVADLQEERDKSNGRIETLEGRLELLEVKQRLRDDYIALLRMHINNGYPPPPPEWPAGLK